jgi:hypothetical protein
MQKKPLLKKLGELERGAWGRRYIKWPFWFIIVTEKLWQPKDESKA